VVEDSAAIKQAKRQARQLREAARQAFSLGDYSRVRELNGAIARLVPDTELGREATQEADRLRTDPVAIYLGLGAVAVYGMAWILALS
jgi:hypothetical protein